MKKFSNEFWLEVRKDFDSKMPQSELRKKYDLSNAQSATLGMICGGKNDDLMPLCLQFLFQGAD